MEKRRILYIAEEGQVRLVSLWEVLQREGFEGHDAVVKERWLGKVDGRRRPQRATASMEACRRMFCRRGGYLGILDDG